MKTAKEWTNELDQESRQRGFYDACLYMVGKIQKDARSDSEAERERLRSDRSDLMAGFEAAGTQVEHLNKERVVYRRLLGRVLEEVDTNHISGQLFYLIKESLGK